MSLERISMNRNLILGADIDDSVTESLMKSILNINYDDDLKQKEFADFKREPIKLYINTNGGSVLDTLGLVGVIENSKTPIYTICTGKALSGGIIVLLAGYKRFAYKYSTVMYHGIAGFLVDKVEGIKQSLEQADKEQNIIDDIVLNKTNILKEKLEEIRQSKKDWFISAQEALKLGIIDEIIDFKR